MQVDIHDSKKMICIWLTKSESEDHALIQAVNASLDMYRKEKYMICFFLSGDSDLTEMTSSLLLYNRTLFAEYEVRGAKDS